MYLEAVNYCVEKKRKIIIMNLNEILIFNFKIPYKHSCDSVIDISNNVN